MQKRYVIVVMVVLVVCVLIWKVSGSYALYNQGYIGNNIISGKEWSMNIINVSTPTLLGDAKIIKEVSTIGTTLNFEINMPKPDSKITFDFDIENMGTLNGELYALTLSGLSTVQSEYINYEIIPLDYVTIKTEDKEGSIIKSKEKQSFRITVSYQENVNGNNIKDDTLNLSSTIIYQQK